MRRVLTLGVASLLTVRTAALAQAPVAARAYAVGMVPAAAATRPPSVDTAGAAIPARADSVPRRSQARRRTPVVRRVLIGAAAGFAAGAVWGYQGDHANQRSYCRAHEPLPCNPEPLQLTGTLVTGGLLAIVGAFVGGLVLP